MKISEAFDLYKNNYMFVKGSSKRLLQNNEYVKKQLVECLGDIEIESLTLSEVSEWVKWSHASRKKKDAERKNNTIRNDIISLRVVLKYMRLIGYKVITPELIPVPKREDVERPFLTADEVKDMIENAYNIRNAFVVSLFYSSGIRLSELISLNRSSIQNRQFQVVGKGKKARLCFIDERTERLMNEYLDSRDDDCDALIISKIKKARMTPTNVQLLIKNTANRAGIKKRVSPHILRHSFATNFLQNNGNIRYLSTMLGHSSVDTTSIYAHVVDNDLHRQYLSFHTI